MSKFGHYQPEADTASKIYIKQDPRLADVGHFHEAVEIVAVLEGEIEAFHMDKSIRLSEGEIFFADSFECHYYRKISDEIKAIIIVLSNDYLRVYRDMYADKKLPSHLNDIEKNKSVIRYMESWLNDNTDDFMLNIGYSNIVLSKLIEIYGLEKREKKKDKDIGVKLLEFIHEHYVDDISLKDVSKQLGYTKEYCSKIFSKVVGINFREYLNFVRYKKACEYLSVKNELRMSTSEIIYKCGFNSSATFYRVAKEQKIKNINF